MKIAYYVHGRGRGHASRSRPMVEALLEDGHQVALMAGGQALDLLADLPCLRPVPAYWPGWRSDLLFPYRVLRELLRLWHLDAQVVISDGDVPSLLAARLLGRGTVSVGHGLIFWGCKLPPGLPEPAVRRQRQSSRLCWWLGEKVLAAHFLPLLPSASKVRVARPQNRFFGVEPCSEGFLLCYFRDRNGEQVVRRLLEAGQMVRCFGDPELRLEGVESYGFDGGAFARMLPRCAGVVGSAGSNLCFEAVTLGKPMLALYARGDTEQQLNALLMEQRGVGRAACLEEVTSDTVAQFLAGQFGRVEVERVMPDTVTVLRELLRQ